MLPLAVTLNLEFAILVTGSPPIYSPLLLIIPLLLLINAPSIPTCIPFSSITTCLAASASPATTLLVVTPLASTVVFPSIYYYKKFI